MRQLVELLDVIIHFPGMSHGNLTNRAWDGDPLQHFIQLKGQYQHVDPRDLRNRNTIRCWKRGVEDSFGSSQDFIKGRQTLD